jgi:hypothetical protein
LQLPAYLKKIETIHTNTVHALPSITMKNKPLYNISHATKLFVFLIYFKQNNIYYYYFMNNNSNR